jgi:hypothetical protein
MGRSVNAVTGEIDPVRRWYGSDFRGRLTIVATIDDIYYGLALMRSRMA